MLNMIRMDVYRLFKMKSLYVIWAIMAILIILTTYMSKEEFKDVTLQSESYEEYEDDGGPDNLGMSVTLTTQPGEKVTAYDMIYANMQGKVVALFIVIFVVLFSTADVSSGYMKNIGGQVRKRGALVISKVFTIFFYTVLSIGVFSLIQVLSCQIFFGYIRWGNIENLLLYLGTQTLLHFALALICMAFAIILRNNVITMIIAVCLCMNMMTIVYSMLDRGIAKIGVKDFHVIDYTITGKMSEFSMNITGKESLEAIWLSIVFIVLATVLSSVIFEKRDIG